METELGISGDNEVTARAKTGAASSRSTRLKKRFGVGCCAVALASTSSAGCQLRGNDAEQKTATAREMKRVIEAQIERWEDAAQELKTALPSASGRGWDPLLDAAALEQSRGAWARARTAYELIEGAIAPLFPESDLATDARYDDFLSELGAEGDPDAFDAEGVIGMHAIERVLWADQIPAEVVAFERGLPGYRPARFPQTEGEARDFKEKLTRRMLDEIRTLRAEFQTLELDPAFAFHGLIGLSGEQVEKVDRASTGQEESRYARATLKDLRANREGCLAGYRAFRPWLLERAAGGAVDTQVMAAFERLRVAYDAVNGDAIPRPPAGFSTVAPSAEQLKSPFGQLYAVVQHESDPTAQSSLRFELHRVAELLELPTIVTR